jgi:restriction system protein
MQHQRLATWIREDVPRDTIDQDLRCSLGAFLPVCRNRRNNAEERLKALLKGTEKSSPVTHRRVVDVDEAGIDVPVDLRELARDQIRQRLSERSWSRLRPLVGQVLRRTA